MRLGAWTLAASLVLLGAEAVAQVSVPGGGIRLDLPADWGPVLCEGRLQRSPRGAMRGIPCHESRNLTSRARIAPR